jgi:hypothetical protein
MSKVQRGLAAAIGGALLSLSAMSMAPARACEKMPDRKAIHNPAPVAPKADTELHSFPTWPEGSPDFHGTAGG